MSAGEPTTGLQAVLRFPQRRWDQAAPRRALLRVAWGAAPVLSAVTLGLVAGAALLPSLFSLATGNVVTRAVGRQAGLERALVVLGALFIGQQLVGPLVAVVSQRLGTRVNVHLQRRLLAASLAPAGVGHLEDDALRDVVTRARGVGPGNVTPNQAISGLAVVISRRLGVVGAAIVLCRYSVPLAVVNVAMNMTLLLRMKGELLRDVTHQIDRTQGLRRADYARELVLRPDASKEVRVFGLGGFVLDRFGGAWLGAMRDIWAARTSGLIGASALLATSGAVTGGSLAYLGHRTAGGSLAIGGLAVAIQSVLGVAGMNFDQNDLFVEWGAAAVPAVLELEARCADVAAAEPGGTQPPPPGAPTHELAFEGVGFTYPGRDTPVYTSLDLRIPAGESLAIVGLNGAGKTTLVKLLAGLRQPTAGRIAVDGIPLADLDLRAWQRRVAAIFQDFTHYELDVRTNVAFGGHELAADAAAVERAVERAGAKDLVDGLPNGLDTLLSRRFSGGVDLSGGQWQRIALARALFAVENGATVLVLDEPTAALDARAEAELFDRFLELTEGVTTLLISHRFSTVRRADRICVLDEGRVVELGTHDELVALGGRYAELFALQAARFVADAAAATGAVAIGGEA